MRPETVRPPVIAERKGIIALPELCRLYKLWSDLGRAGQEDLRDAAEGLKRLLSPLLQKRAFLSLWCKEDSDREISSDLPALETVHKSDVSRLESFSDPVMGLQLSSKDQLAVVTTLTGDHTTLGAIQAGDVEIRAFGPQSGPLSESKGFGIYRMPDGGPIEKWTACAAYPDIWFSVQSQIEKKYLRLDLKFLGLTESSPLFFVFYVKAKEAMVDKEIFQPKALRRYHGEIRSVLFDNQLSIQGDVHGKMELIPLAGGGCFWDSEFLLAFEILSCNDTISFEITAS